MSHPSALLNLFILYPFHFVEFLGCPGDRPKKAAKVRKPGNLSAVIASLDIAAGVEPARPCQRHPVPGSSSSPPFISRSRLSWYLASRCILASYFAISDILLRLRVII
jgi:hypothetical protein